jgi:hypothetical protein
VSKALPIQLIKKIFARLIIKNRMKNSTPVTDICPINYEKPSEK